MQEYRWIPVKKFPFLSRQNYLSKKEKCAICRYISQEENPVRQTLGYAKLWVKRNKFLNLFHDFQHTLSQEKKMKDEVERVNSYRDWTTIFICFRVCNSCGWKRDLRNFSTWLKQSIFFLVLGYIRELKKIGTWYCCNDENKFYKKNNITSRCEMFYKMFYKTMFENLFY